MIDPRKEPMGLLLISVAFATIVMVFIGYLNVLHKSNIEKTKKSKPVNREKITFNNVIGIVESIHPWGRTEIVPMKSIELEYFQYCDEWVMYGDVIQPDGRKDYFMPVLRGHLDLDVKDLTQTWTEYSSYETGSIDKPETYEDFRLAHIKVEEGKITNIDYTHYRLRSNHTWGIIASWTAETIQTKNE